ncbi:M20/M25/M40 family metallo-hydrolase [Alteromonas sp. a30]|uniref:M20/M25/M40 family metallo-hydrolase n=1 Tax=Alteromonas sp. a30 TaxID=2730917 RepID=UPI0022820AF3|nr:M20/M25/M40 family metallo-hydrolase [Alteromonas sp. a30]MCY7297264.1 M20/M25/M40 family metallo-hydrolase [Alteromonas sp. a30]
MHKVFLATILLVGVMGAKSVFASETFAHFTPHLLHYDLDVELNTEDEKVSVKLNASILDNPRVNTLYAPSLPPTHFALRKGTEITDSNIQLTHLPQPNGLYDVYQMKGPWPDSGNLKLNYNVDMKYASHYKPIPKQHLHSPQNNTKNNKGSNKKNGFARSFYLSEGEVNTKGVYLSGASYWYPIFDQTWYTFSITAKHQKGLKNISQGHLNANTWHNDKPNPEIFLIANAFHVYREPFNRQKSDLTANTVALEAYLLEPDVGLAHQYLEAASRYLEMYEHLLGSYPYSKFSLIENFWESGYGMPSFTLLGSEVIRLPFILHTSYPHELVHNWLGNGVFPPSNGENWSEGLTTYLADHLFAEQKQQGAHFRRDNLQRYVNPENLALIDFSYKKDASSEAVGYVKGMMLWEMLRNRIGDEAFKLGVQEVIKRHLFQEVGFAQLQTTFEQISGMDLSLFFEQWTTRTDIPQLRVVAAKWQNQRQKGKHQIQIELVQQQSGSAYDLDVPIQLCAEHGKEKAIVEWVRMTQKNQRFIVTPPCDANWVAVDPGFQIMRKLYATESPTGLRQALASNEHYWVSLASETTSDAAATQQSFIASLLEATSQHELIEIDPNHTLLTQILSGRKEISPEEKNKETTIWLADDGKTLAFNTWFAQPEKLKTARDLAAETHYFIFGRNPNNSKQKVVLFNLAGWMNKDEVSEYLLNESSHLHTLLQKLPHYRKYSYLGFGNNENGELENHWKGQWPVSTSPMKVNVYDAPYSPNDTSLTSALEGALTASLPKRPPLAELPEEFAQSALKQHVHQLTSEPMQGRKPGTAGIERAADYIFNAFNVIQQSTGTGQVFRQPFNASINDKQASNKRLLTENIVLVLPGSHSSADANAHSNSSSALSMPEEALPQLIVSAHYDHLGLSEKGEAYVGADDNASGVAALLLLAEHFADKSLTRDVLFVAFSAEETGRQGAQAFLEAHPNRIMANINLDTIGRLHNKPIQILNSDSAREWKPIFHGVGYLTGLKFDMPNLALAPSDQGAFLDKSIPAIQLFAGAHFDIHTPQDTADKLDYTGIQNITRATAEVIEYLANRNEALTSRATKNMQASRGKQRKVRTGILPDYTYSGAGIKVELIEPKTGAEKAGIKPGDVILQIDTTPLRNLAHYSEVLQTYKAGQVVQMTLRREGQSKMTLEVKLNEL